MTEMAKQILHKKLEYFLNMFIEQSSSRATQKYCSVLILNEVIELYKKYSQGSLVNFPFVFDPHLCPCMVQIKWSLLFKWGSALTQQCLFLRWERKRQRRRPLKNNKLGAYNVCHFCPTTYCAASGNRMPTKLCDNVSVYISWPAPHKYSESQSGVCFD